MNEIEMEGKNVEDAIAAGLAKLCATRDQVDVKILSEGSSGLFGLMGSKAASVRLTLKGGAQDGSAGAAVDFALLNARATELLGQILKLMNIPFSGINRSMLAGRVSLEIKSPESALVIGKNGATLDAIEMLLNLMLARSAQTRAKVTVDTEKYRMRREEKLTDIAMRGAAAAKAGNKPFCFEPMNSHDRRIVHLALKGDPSVETVSDGEGAIRRVIVKPKQQ